MISDKIKVILAQTGLTQLELADLLSVPLNRVKNLANGRVKKFSPHEVETLVARLKINPTWLTTGDGGVFQTPGEQEFLRRIDAVKGASQDAHSAGGLELAQRLKQEILLALREGREDLLSGAFRTIDAMACDRESLALVPLVRARLSAGSGSLETEAREEARYAFRREWVARKGRLDSMVLMKVVGDSMEPDFRDGDMALIDQSQNEIIAGGYFAVGIEDTVVIKVLYPSPGRLILRSINPVYPPIEVPLSGDLADMVRIIGRVIWWCREAR